MIRWLIEQLQLSEKLEGEAIMNSQEDVKMYYLGRKDMILEILKYIEDERKAVKK